MATGSRLSEEQAKEMVEREIGSKMDSNSEFKPTFESGSGVVKNTGYGNQMSFKSDDTFSVEIKREAGNGPLAELGLVCIHEPRKIVIKEIEPGLITKWNEEHSTKPEQRVRVGDVILAVNDVHGDANAMGNALKHDKELNLAICHGISSGENEAYTWKQSHEEIEINFKKPFLQKGDSKLLKIMIRPWKTRIEFKGELFLEGDLVNEVAPDGSAWDLNDGLLQITLSKAKVDEMWTSVFKHGLAMSEKLIPSEDELKALKDAARKPWTPPPRNESIDPKHPMANAYDEFSRMQATYPPTEVPDATTVPPDELMPSATYNPTAKSPSATTVDEPMPPVELVLDGQGNSVEYLVPGSFSPGVLVLASLILAWISVKKYYQVGMTAQSLQEALMQM